MFYYKSNSISAIQYITTKSINQPVPLIIFFQSTSQLLSAKAYNLDLRLKTA